MSPRTRTVLLLVLATCGIAFLALRYGRGLALDAISQSIQQDFSDIATVEPDSLHRWIADAGPEDGPVLLDVRTPEEYAVSHLPGALNVHPDETDFIFLEGIARDQPIVTYCSVGFRSAELARRLQAAGYGHVLNLEGSIFAWANAGYPVVRAGDRVQAVHPYDAQWGLLLRSGLSTTQP